jgi:Kdo2-lipid IVA lauroyltransferase/acyltransferase
MYSTRTGLDPAAKFRDHTDMAIAIPSDRADPTCGVPLLPLSRFWAPRWWPVWIGFALIRALSALPWRLQSALARGLGALAWYLARRDRRTTLINLRLAFPGWDERRRRALAREHFVSLAYGVFETGLVWFGGPARLKQRARLEGREHLDRVLASGRGVLLLGGHFTTNEIAAAVLPESGQYVDIMYKTASNALVNQLMLRRRTAGANARLVPNDQFKELLKTLKGGGIALYAPDQRYDAQGFVIVPLFGVPALSNPGTTFIARATRCAVLPYFPLRAADGQSYVMTIGEPLADFPSGDGAKDVARYHALIEAAVERAPAQYLWSYKRFRPLSGQPDPYRGGAPRGGTGEQN